MKKALIFTLALTSAASFGALAQNAHSTHAQTSAATEMQKELNESMNKMHSDMAKSMNEQNADIAFAEGMIAHHIGAIDMAKIELKYGKDPEMRKLAEAIVNAQGPEIEQMQKWLDRNKK